MQRHLTSAPDTSTGTGTGKDTDTGTGTDTDTGTAANTDADTAAGTGTAGNATANGAAIVTVLLRVGVAAAPDALGALAYKASQSYYISQSHYTAIVFQATCGVGMCFAIASRQLFCCARVPTKTQTQTSNLHSISI